MSAVENLRVQADWNRNLLYDHELTDITDRVLSAEWSCGYDAPNGLVSPPMKGVLVLDNRDGAFNAKNPSALYASVLRRDVLIRFLHLLGPTGSAPFTMAVLRVLDIQIAPSRFGPRSVQLMLGDFHAEMMSTIYDPPLQTNKSIQEALQQAFTTDVILPQAYASLWWVVGASILDSGTVLAQGSFTSSSTSTTLDYVGDNIDRGQGVSLYSFVEEMCTAEMMGRFFTQSSGAGITAPYQVMYGRNTFAESYNSANTTILTADHFVDTGNEYEFGRTICNKLEVTFYPRVLGAANTEIARNDSAMLIPGVGLLSNKSSDSQSNTRQFTLRYRDPNYPDGTCAATAIIDPVASTDYVGNLAADGSGEDYTSNLVVTVVNNTNSAQVTVSNTALGDVYLTLLKIRGTPLTANQPVTLVAADAQSIYDYGLQRESMTIAGIDNEELVQSYANWYVKTRKDSVARFRRVSFDFPNDTGNIIYEPAFNAPLRLAGVYIVDPWIEGISNARMQWVAGERHTIEMSDDTWVVTWFLEDYLTQTPWLLDDEELSILDTSARIGF